MPYRPLTAFLPSDQARPSHQLIVVCSGGTHDGVEESRRMRSRRRGFFFSFKNFRSCQLSNFRYRCQRCGAVAAAAGNSLPPRDSISCWFPGVDETRLGRDCYVNFRGLEQTRRQQQNSAALSVLRSGTASSRDGLQRSETYVLISSTSCSRKFSSTKDRRRRIRLKFRLVRRLFPLFFKGLG